MNYRFFRVLLALVFAASAVAGGAMEFEYGPRPSLSVFDPSGFLKPGLMKEISEPLAVFYKRDGIDVIVVVLPDIGDAPPEHVAGRFAGAWCKAPLHCVVLYVPGRADSPWIVPSGPLVGHLNPEQVKQAVDNARRRAAAEPKEPDKVKAAATEAADMIRFWMANAVNRSETFQSEATKMRLELETKSRQWKIGVMVGVASLIPLLAGISFLMVYLRNRGPAYFPTQSWQLRLGAPYAGGNHAVSDLGPPLP